MLTTCPKCAHTFNSPQQPNVSQCCKTVPMATVTSSHHYVNQPPPPPRTYVNVPQPHQQCLGLQHCQTPSGAVSVSLQLPPSGSTTVSITTSNHAAPCVTLTAFTCPDTSHRVLAGMAGGGIVSGNNVILQEKHEFTHPQPSPSVPLSFVLPTPPPHLTFPWGQWPQPWTQPQSETDLVRIAATLKALRISGWYYEGLSWQDSSDLLRDTTPGTFLVRDSSDPRFLFSLSVQTDRGPTSVRLHYVCGQFRLDAERRLAPMMPVFDCVVKLVEHYIRATKDSGYTKENMLRKDQVWVDARGHMYSHILLTNALYKPAKLPTLQHLARLAINDQIAKRSSQGINQLPIPGTLKKFLTEYPHAH